MKRKGRIGLLVGIALVLVALLALTGVTQASPSGTGAVCPAGNVKSNVGSGYEYSDGSAWINAAEQSVCWGANPGYEVTGSCIKIGGPGGGSLLWFGPGDGCAGPFEYAASHAVVYTSQLPPEPTPTLPPGEPTPTPPPGRPTPTPIWEPTPPNWPLCWPRIEVGVTGCVPSGGSISQWFEGRVLSDRTWKGETLLIDADYDTTYEFRWWSPSTGPLTIGYVTTDKEVKGALTCPTKLLTYPFPCVGEPTPVPPPPELPETGFAPLANPLFIANMVILGILILVAGVYALRKLNVS